MRSPFVLCGLIAAAGLTIISWAQHAGGQPPMRSVAPGRGRATVSSSAATISTAAESGTSSAPANEDTTEVAALKNQDAAIGVDIGSVLAEYKNTETEADRQKLRQRLTELLSEQFTLRQQRRENEIQQIESRVKKLRELLQKRTDAQQKIVERRLNELLSDAEGLGWGDSEPDVQSRPASAYGRE
jgi:hypothetical protein